MSRFLALLFIFAPAALAKTGSGKFQLSSFSPSSIVAKFSVAAGAKGLMTAVLTSMEKYEREDSLRMHLYRDDDWPEVQKAKTCQEKTQLARQTVQIKFALEDAKLSKMWGFKKQRWRSDIELKIEVTEKEEENHVPRHHYWYIAVDDCSLEGQKHLDLEIPPLRFHYQIYNMLTENALTHLSTDEFHLSRLHTFTMFLSGVICLFLFGKICYHLQQSGIVHIAKIIVLSGASFDTASSAFELVHMTLYRFDGMGWDTLDAISAYNEAVCDAIVSVLLLAVAAGWTLPSDVISIGRNHDASPFQNILMGLANPVGWLNPFSGLFLGLLAIHVFLAHWGLSYNDDYDSYHDFEHLPGKILMSMRSTLGFFMLAAIAHTRTKCNASLHRFYATLAIVGTIWFQGLPAITWLCNTLVPYHERHPTVIISSALLQSTSLLLLSWLVAIHDSSAYHRVSHITQTGDNLTEKLAGTNEKAAIWSFFFG